MALKIILCSNHFSTAGSLGLKGMLFLRETSGRIIFPRSPERTETLEYGAVEPIALVVANGPAVSEDIDQFHKSSVCGSDRRVQKERWVIAGAAITPKLSGPSMLSNRGGVGCFFLFLGFQGCYLINALIELSGDLVPSMASVRSKLPEEFLRTEFAKAESSLSLLMSMRRFRADDDRTRQRCHLSR